MARQITNTDYPMYLGLQESVFGADEWPPVEKYMMNRTNYVHLGMVVDNKLVAGISAKITGDEAELVLICTRMESRNNGYANILLSELIDHLKRKDISVLYVENYLESAKSWYTSHGFKEYNLILYRKIQ